MDDRQPLDTSPDGRPPILTERLVTRLVWAFVCLGVGLRVARYLMNYPLWWDEAFVGVNLLRRGYFDLLRPLDYGQVCPILFLWAELTVVKLLGFSEWTLRLFPLLAAVASVVLFRHAAGRVLRGIPLVLAVAIFAVSFHPIRHAADVKPYASDLLVALVLLTLVIEWWRTPERTGWLWALAAFAPLAVATSHPAVFAAGGIGIGLAPAVVRSGRRDTILAYSTFLLSTAGSFLGLYAVFTRAQSTATLSLMQAQWGAAFPPLDGPLTLAAWLVRVHTGGMLAYPCGGENGASGLTLLLFAIGGVVLWKRGRTTLLWACLAPFGLALVAAALRRYPYGGVAHGSPARVMQYLAPAVCLIAGLGAATVLDRIASSRLRFRALRLSLTILVVIGVVPLVVDSFHPYRAVHAEKAREFARSFWPAFDRDAQPVCLRWDLGLGEWDSTNLNVAVYLCNQQIYSPRRRRPERLDRSANQPVRCVLSFSDPDDPRVASWVESMTTRYRLSESREIDVNMASPEAKARVERYHVYEFLPKDNPIQTARRPD